MKKITALLLCLVLLASLAACGTKAEQPEDAENNGDEQTRAPPLLFPQG